MEAFQFTERILDRLGLDIVISEETEKGEEKRALLLRDANGLGKVVFMKEGKRVEIGPFRDENAETGLSSYPFVLWDRTLLPILSAYFDTLWGEGEWTIDKRSETSLRLFEDLDVSYGDVRSIERRYEGENMILEMVKSGDVRVVEAFSLSGSSLFSAVEKRNPSALRNIQNYAIIANSNILHNDGFRTNKTVVFNNNFGHFIGSLICIAQSATHPGQGAVVCHKNYSSRNINFLAEAHHIGFRECIQCTGQM